MARPAFAIAPAVKMKSNAPEACQRDRPKGIVGLGEQKKSISLPIVNGTLIDTADDRKSRPMAMSRGFFSGLARDTIFRNDDDELVPSSALPKTTEGARARRAKIEGAGGG